MLSTEPIIYEQPINEHIRVCLRLEFLFNKVMHWLHGSSTWDSSAALISILEILNVLDRPDVKSKLVKELSRYATLLGRFEEVPHVDRSKLTAIVHEVEHTIRNLHSMQGRIAQTLRENEFLSSVRQYLLTPGMGGNFDIPAYHYWLHQPPAERIAQLTHWLSAMKTIQTAVNLTLRLIRQSSPFELHVAHEGFYQAALDAQAPCQLVRVGVPRASGVYPVISVGRHGVSIRFYTLNIAERSFQTKEDIRFQLACCIF